RISVKGGGCSGLAYNMEWAEAPRERDKIFEQDGVRVFVDPKSYLYLIGTELVYEDGLMASGFKLRNPNVKSTCGCGESFTL
ncbi:MAG: HesB/IscA family protein, partial [Myxococcaceae bacterium]